MNLCFFFAYFAPVKTKGCPKEGLMLIIGVALETYCSVICKGSFFDGLAGSFKSIIL